MEHTLEEHGISKTTAKDFFLWLGFIITFYASVTALITLIFEYINIAFPDTLYSYSDPYSGSIRFAMATLIVLAPTAVVLLHTIRIRQTKDMAKQKIWARHWALILTMFLAGGAVVVDVITLINTFLGGETSERFILKIFVVLLLALGIFIHFLADSRGYWITNGKKATTIGIAALILCTVAIGSGFLIIGSPQTARMLRYDAQKVSDIQNIEYQIITYWQQKEKLPATLPDLNDPLSSYTIPHDPQTGVMYEYRATSSTTFEICATFNQPSPVTASMSAPSYGPDSAFISGNLSHESGHTCFTRVIDPQRYPPSRTTKPL